MALLSLLGGSGCTTFGATRASALSALEAPSDLPDAARLDVAVIEFDPGLPEAGEPIPEDLYPEIRQAEAKLLAVRLKQTLEATGHWGAVGILPAEPTAADVTLSAEILHSDGRELELLVRVRDASGRLWLERRFRTTTLAGSYASADHEIDPYQPMFNTIANEMLKARSRLDTQQLEEIATISELQFASQLSPEAFDGYLQVGRDGEVKIARLPARDEPMLERIREVRLREEMFVEAMGIHYQGFASKIGSNYWYWRRDSSQEIDARAALRKEQIQSGAWSFLALAGAVATGVLVDDSRAQVGAGVIAAVVIQQQLRKIAALERQREMHQEGLRELAESFQAEAQPIVVELDTTNVRLTGTTAAQYAEWQRLLRDVYLAENALIADVYRVPRQPSAEPWIGDNTLPMVPFERGAGRR